jgi:DNA-binding beta-propeller fold protein YncE
MSLRLSALRFSIVVGILAGCPVAAEPFISYRIVASTLAGDRGAAWDHVSVDPANRHIFIGRGADGLMVADAATGEPIATVPDTKGSHGAAIASDLGLGFSDDGPGGIVTVFDLATLQSRARFKAGENTDGVFYDPATKQGFVNNGAAGTITVFDAATFMVKGTVDLATKKPEFAAVDGVGHAYIDLQDRNSVAVVDLASRKVVNVWPVQNCEQPSSLWYEPQSERLFVGCRGAKPVLAVVNSRTGATVADVPIGAGNDWVGFDKINHLILLSNGAAASLSVIRQKGPDDYALEETVGTRPLARTGTFDPTTGKLFLVAGQYAKLAPSGAGPEPQNHVFPGTVEILVLERRTE